MKKYDSIIFDLDGTLWSTLDSCTEVLKEIKKRHKEITKDLTIDDVKDSMGLTFPETAKKFYGYLDKDLREKYAKEAIEENVKRLTIHGGILYKNVEEVIKELAKDYKLYIVSNCIEGYIESFLYSSKLEKYFLDFENNGRTGLSKGENIKLLMNRNHLSNSIYIGDTIKDKEASQYVNIPFVYASYGFGKVDNYDYKIDNISDLLHIFYQSKVLYQWHDEKPVTGMEILQVSGILLNDKNEVLLYKEENGKYRIPGGHPKQEESIEETLIRECLEEVNAEIENIIYLGYQEVIGDKKTSYAQVRLLATIKKLGPNRPDLDNGKIYERYFLPLDKVNDYLNWKEVGQKMINRVQEMIKNEV